MEFLQQSWVIIAAAIGGITLIWNFAHKTLKEIIDTITKPIKDLDQKVENLNKKVDINASHNDKVSKALLTMQRNSLMRSCEEFLRNGYATTNEKSTISDQYTSYSELGGDSFVTDMVANIMKLPLEKPTRVDKVKSKAHKIEQVIESDDYSDLNK